MCACSEYAISMQYTIRGITSALDAELRRRARASGQSLNQAALDALLAGAGLSGIPEKRRAMDGIAGSWVSDRAFDAAIAAQDQVDEGLWT